MDVFVVDDEYLQRELVKKTIDWKALDMQVTGEAEDGEEALRKALLLKPDVMIMDINIPYINGIEVSRKVKEVLPDTQVIILTAYGEFQYAREALAFGAVSFVLKPVNPVELTAELQKCKEKLDEIRSRENSIKKMREQITRKQKEQFLLEQISGIVPPVREQGVWNSVGCPAACQIAVFYLRFPEEERPSARALEIEEMVQDYFSFYEVLEIDRDNLFILFGSREMEFQLQLLSTYLQEEMNHKRDFWGGVSLVHDGPQELREAYLEAYSAGKRGESCGKISVYEPVSIAAFLKEISYEPDKLLSELRRKDYKAFREEVSRCFGQMEKMNSHPQAVYYVAVDILMHFTFYLAELGIDFSSEIEKDQRLFSRLGENGNVREMKEALLRFLDEGQRLVKDHRLPATKKKVQDAREFIDKNYYRFEMSLNLVADAIGVNASYLSNIFKKECGCSLSRYLTNVRLEQAKHLMESTPRRTLAEISEAVGYGDVYYFSKNFKNYYGITPSKYQE